MNRRKYLTALGATTASLGLSGCMGILGGGDTDTDTTTTPSTTETTSTTAERDTTAAETTDNETDTATTSTTAEQSTTNETTVAETSPPDSDITITGENDEYVITHAGGDPITDQTTSKVSVVVNGTPLIEIVADEGRTQQDYPFKEGDSASVYSSSGDAAIQVVWYSEDGSEKALLAKNY